MAIATGLVADSSTRALTFLREVCNINVCRRTSTVKLDGEAYDRDLFGKRIAVPRSARDHW